MKRDNKQIKETDEDKKPLQVRGWVEFRKSGLLFLTNQFLHIFGWTIVYQYLNPKDDKKNIEPTNVFVARTSFRGFGEKSQDRGYIAISKYMKDNSEELYNEVMTDE